MNGVSGGGSESESCSRCHDEGNMIDSNGVAHPTTAPHDGSHTSCTLYSLGPRGGILDIYFEPSHISSATIYPIYYNGWEGYLGHNGWKLFYTTDTAQKRNAEFNPGEEHAAGELEGDTYGNGGFEGWTECFAQFPRFDDGGALKWVKTLTAPWKIVRVDIQSIKNHSFWVGDCHRLILVTTRVLKNVIYRMSTPVTGSCVQWRTPPGFPRFHMLECSCTHATSYKVLKLLPKT